MSRPALTLSGRTAVVSGAASGIGRALAREAAARGMTVAICDRDAAGLAETERLVRDSGAECLAMLVDVTSADAVARFATDVAALPPVGLLFANAGILRQGSMLTLPPDDLRLLFEVNVVGALRLVQSFVPAMRAAGAPAQIVITGSQGSMANYPQLTGYCATKHALWPIAEGLRADLADEGAPIGVSLLMPGSVATAIFDESDPGHTPAADAITPDAAARIAFEGALGDRPLILTHPAFAERARTRFESVLRQMTTA